MGAEKIHFSRLFPMLIPFMFVPMLVNAIILDLLVLKDTSAEQTPDTFELVLADGTVHKYKGSLIFADRAIDPLTGTLGIEATFPNPDRLLRPGQYARLRAEIDQKPNAILVPQIAVQELQGTYSVAVVGSDNKVTLRPVQAGERFGSLWVIDSGLNAGEKVIVEGITESSRRCNRETHCCGNSGNQLTNILLHRRHRRKDHV